MKQNISEPFAQTEVAAAPPTTGKSRRPRRMAREPGSVPELPVGPNEPAKPATSRPETKIAGVVTLLRREEGATLVELIAATGWLPHTTRAALTGLRKKGHAIAKFGRDGTTCYRIEQAA